jgi:hypothetical protein
MNLPKAYDGIASTIITTVILRLAQLPNTNRRQAQVASTGKAEAHCKSDYHGLGIASWKPQAKNEKNAEAYGGDDGIISS